MLNKSELPSPLLCAHQVEEDTEQSEDGVPTVPGAEWAQLSSPHSREPKGGTEHGSLGAICCTD